MKIKVNKKIILYFIVFLLINVLFFLAGSFTQSNAFENLMTRIGFVEKTEQEPPKPHEEIVQILSTRDLKKQTQLYTQLIKRIGPVKAQEELYKSGLPFDGQTHLLNHTVGDLLYKTLGDRGLRECKDYFLSSCYHGFLIRFIAEKGIGDLDNVMQQCWKSDLTTAVQCAHGIGHGLLANHGYANLPEALKSCDRVNELSENFPLYNCHDGVFMENNWAVHEDGNPSPDRWIDPNDPVFPCNDPSIAEKYRKACWSNQAQLMFKDHFHGNIKRVAQECEKLPDEEYKVTCFDSLARQVHPLTNNSVSETFRLCNLFPEGEVDECVHSIVRAYFSVGDRKLPFEICSNTTDPKKHACFRDLAEVIIAYYPRHDERQKFCGQIPIEPVRVYCMYSENTAI